MNKPDPPELYARAEGFFKRAKDAGGRALISARGAGERAWSRATERRTMSGIAARSS